MRLNITALNSADPAITVRPVGLTADQSARLIAAAPDLLDALRRVLRHIPADFGGASLSDDIHRARRAIARATGADE